MEGVVGWCGQLKINARLSMVSIKIEKGIVARIHFFVSNSDRDEERFRFINAAAGSHDNKSSVKYCRPMMKNHYRRSKGEIRYKYAS